MCERQFGRGYLRVKNCCEALLSLFSCETCRCLAGDIITGDFGPSTLHPQKFFKFCLWSLFLGMCREKTQNRKFSKSALPSEKSTNINLVNVGGRVVVMMGVGIWRLHDSSDCIHRKISTQRFEPLILSIFQGYSQP